MPWLYYPKANAVLYGYLSDGIITGFLYLLILIFAIYTYRKKYFNIYLSLITGVAGLLMGLEAYYKISEIEAEKINFSTENPIIALSTAGFTQGSGIYVMGLAGLGIFFTVVFGLLLQNRFEVNSKDSQKQTQKPTLVFGIILLVAGGLLAGLYFFQSPEIPDKEEIKNTISSGISDMTNALINEKYDEFVAYNHPIMVQSYGGKQKTVELLRASIQELKKSGYTIKNVSMGDVYDIQIDKSNIQVVFGQILTLESADAEKQENQKMLAVSENGGKTWYFINITNKNKGDILKSFPGLNQNLKF